ncbi:hypothetical protein CDD83_5009 [Cordyceps sp. RAO-2017]|nr:hypothetical protein CDD83_5009 [Cordyceps sp. RAO-2017]
MSADDKNSTSNYAPKSPDLSSFYSSGPTLPAQKQGDYSSRPPSAYQPPSSSPASSAFVSPVSPGGRHDLGKPDFYASLYSPSAQQRYQPPSPQQSTLPSQPLPYGLPQFHHQPAYFQPHVLPGHGQQQHPPQHPPQCPASDTDALTRQLTPEMPPRRAAAGPPPPPAIEPSPVRTKFPTARIKRIMQADEEVGKVAQQTPIAVGKALELFMIQLVTKSAELAKEKGSKRVTAPMLKHVVETDDQWDFLRDIVGRVENEKEGSKAKAKAESDSEDDVSEPKKRGRGAGRRKRTA